MQRAAWETVCELKRLGNVLKSLSQILWDFGHCSTCYITQASHACFQEAGRVFTLPICCGVSEQAHGQSQRSCSSDQDRYRGTKKEDKLGPRGRHGPLLTGGKRNKSRNHGSQLCVYKVNTVLDRYRYMLGGFTTWNLFWRKMDFLPHTTSSYWARMDRQLRNNFVSLATVFIYFSLCNATCA